MATSNPVLKPSLLSRRGAYAARQTDVMTVAGAVNKTILLSLLLVASAAFSWFLIFPRGAQIDVAGAGPSSLLFPLLMGGGIGALMVGLVISFKPRWAPGLAPVYSILEGLLLGALSASMEMRYPGIPMQASFLTMGTLLSLLLAYKSGFIQITDRFRAGVVAATGGIMIVYLLSMLLSFFGMPMNFMHDSSPMSLGISAVVLVVAAMNLLLDFDFIEQGAASRAPKYMEWYAGFGLMVTLVWLYIEFLRLLSKLSGRK